MDKEAELSLLLDRSHDLEKEVQDNDYHIERLTHALAAGEEPGRTIEALQDYMNRQNGVMRELGRTEVRIEDLGEQIREEAEQGRETALAQEFAAEDPISQEDYLDWIRPDLHKPAEINAEQERHQGEDRMVQEMEREDKQPEDYLDWMQR